MKSFDFEAVVYDCEVYCVECCPVDVEDEDVAPIFADEEWEYVPVCDVCGREHDYVTLLEEPALWELSDHGNWRRLSWED